MKAGNTIAMLSTGPIGNKIPALLNKEPQYDIVAHYNFPFIKPLDFSTLDVVLASFDHIITLEDGCSTGGFGSAVLEYANRIGNLKNIKIFGIPDRFIPHGTVEELYGDAGMDEQSIKKYVQQFL